VILVCKKMQLKRAHSHLIHSTTPLLRVVQNDPGHLLVSPASQVIHLISPMKTPLRAQRFCPWLPVCWGATGSRPSLLAHNLARQSDQPINWRNWNTARQHYVAWKVSVKTLASGDPKQAPPHPPGHRRWPPNAIARRPSTMCISRPYRRSCGYRASSSWCSDHDDGGRQCAYYNSSGLAGRWHDA
jgi:hypothetical protein